MFCTLETQNPQKNGRHYEIDRDSGGRIGRKTLTISKNEQNGRSKD